MRGRLEIATGLVLVVAAAVVTMVSADGTDLGAATFLLVYALAVTGVLAVTIGATRIDRRRETPLHEDVRQRIYGVLAVGFALGYAGIMWKVIPNRLPSAMLHLATIPVFTLTMAIGTLVGRRFGWWLAVVSGSVVLLSTVMLIARILVSAAFLAGVYGAFGKAASTFALVAVALIVEAVALFPICLVKFMMSRAGRRAFGV
ncbi:MAG: hypothetical protein H6Q90_345 [Deltaproteobacteria bacterium]|nr:hypothetical protein [Deltaproteobacteria bacterium]